MNKMIVTVFNDEKGAYEGSKALNELHSEGSITLYATAVIGKDPKGKISVKQAADQGPAGTALGLATGSLVGLLAGPAGLVIGAAGGTLAGSIYDIAQAGVSDDFVAEVSKLLAPGKTAVVAEIDEEWVTPLDTRMHALGGTVYRRGRGEFVDAQIEKESAAEKAELAELKAEHDQAVGEAKTKLKAKIDALQKKLQAHRDQLQEKITALKREDQAKIKSLQEQAAKAKSDAKAKVEKRLAEVRAHYAEREEKLGEAWEKVKEAAAV